jgi:peptidoglycan/LPS O-acetylase OafA/YrhL
LRGVAALAVVLYHFTAWYGHGAAGHPAPGPSWVFTRGHFGVELFFIISGFVICLTLERARTARDFAAARIARLYPAFLACLLITLSAGLAFGAPPPTPTALIANATMLPELFGARMIDGSYWSLLYEVVFYSLAAICLLVLRWRAIEALCAAWFAHLFVIGVMLFRMHAGQANRWTVVVLIAALECVFLGPHWSFAPVSVIGYALMIWGFAALVWVAVSPWGRFLAIAPLRFLGRISYPLYLVHQAAGFLLIGALEAWGASPDAAIGAAILAALLIAWGVHAWIEVPAQARLRAWFGRPTRAPALVS